MLIFNNKAFKYNFKLLTTLLVILISFNTRGVEIKNVLINHIVNDTINYKNSGEYYPEIKLSKDDSLILPYTYDIEIFLRKIEDFDIKNSYFYATFDVAAYSQYDSLYITKYNQELEIIPSVDFRLDYKESDELYISNYVYDGIVQGISDSVGNYRHYQYTGYNESLFLHNWNLKNYPFDSQELEIRFVSFYDTSLVKLASSKVFPPSFNKKMRTLKEGYKINQIKSFNEYIESSSIIKTGPSEERFMINDNLVFNIIIDREGSFLYFKLFLGTFLSFLISYLVFFIPIKDFESRMTLSVGGIFGAVGNRYFVESFMPGVQVLTKADLINNLIILLIVMNIVIVIAQHNKKINFGFLERNRNSAIFSAILFIISNLIIVYI
mgnify:CR=1 FL=1|tara:strand:+ start:48 stop:1190 length:1143 start_codon:yes stop_codon:yes gene_type:complete